MVYVDDLVIIGTDDESSRNCGSVGGISEDKEVGTLEDGEEILYLGRRLRRDVDTIYIITPTAHLDKTVEILEIDDDGTIATPGTTALKFWPFLAYTLDIYVLQFSDISSARCCSHGFHPRSALPICCAIVKFLPVTSA